MTFNLQAPPIHPRTPTEEQIAALAPWFHNITLPGGEQTAPEHPLGDFPRFKWEEIRASLPANLRGKTALDIGCNAGFYSLELARRGARVVGIDHDEHYLTQARWAADQWGLGGEEPGRAGRLDYRRMDIWELARDHAGLPAAYDIVLFMGVLYHLRHPLLGLEIAAHRTADGGLLVFQTLTTSDERIEPSPEDLSLEDRHRLSESGWPRMSFIEHEFASDHTNWWIPNAACCEAMVRSVGLKVATRPGHEIYVCTRDRSRSQAPPAEISSLLGTAGAQGEPH